jgi:membrane protein
VIGRLQAHLNQSKFAQLFLQTVIKWQRDECLEKGAALAYYALFSLFPILMVILSVFGLILGPNTDTYQEILNFAKGALPPEAFKPIENTLINLNRSSVGAGLIGFGILLLTASKIFEALDRSVDKIWHIHHQTEQGTGIKHVALKAVREKIVGFLLVLSSAFVILLSFLSNIAIKIILEIVNSFSDALGWLEIDDLLLIRSLQTSISLLLLTAVVMFLFKALPSTRLRWTDVWAGSLLTVALLSLLQHSVSNGIIRIGEQFRAYGVIGNVMVLLLWIFLTCQIFFLGCEFTYIYTYMFGSRRTRPRPDLSVEERGTF